MIRREMLGAKYGGLLTIRQRKSHDWSLLTKISRTYGDNEDEWNELKHKSVLTTVSP